MQNSWRRAVVAALIPFALFANSVARGADDAYFDVPFDHLTLTEGKLPESHAIDDWRKYGFRELLRAYAVLDGPGEAFAQSGFATFNAAAPADHIAIHTPKAGDVTGRLFVENGDVTGMTELHFKIAASEAKPEKKEIFYHAMLDHFERLLTTNVSGAAWFRHRANEARRQLGEKEDENQAQARPGIATLDDTYSLFSGNQALAENLQLDKALPAGASRPDVKEVDVNTIEGITVAKIDWTALNKAKDPKKDSLAKDIPADQPAIFVADFPALIALADEADRYGTPLLQLSEPQSQDAGTRQRYERQLGFSLTGLGRLLGPQLISGVAITASDPYLRTGGDIAILFQPKNAAALETILSAQFTSARMAAHDSTLVSATVNGLRYSSSVSPDRSLSSYIATLKDGTIVVTNSVAELGRLADVDSGKSPALFAAPEYTFFRDRYKLGEADESALIVLTDDAIRRWCGARWRIADSRRTRASAVLADLNARYLDALVAGNLETALIARDYPVPNLGELHLTPHGTVSSTYGSLDFLTPISELKLDTVTDAEAQAYKRWRDTYETNWRGVFDPIAIRISVRDAKVTGDLTIMPLIVGTEYHALIDFTSGAKLTPASSDPHDILFQEGVAISLKSETMQMASSTVTQLTPNLKIEPFGWVGQSVWIYADEDPVWEEVLKSDENWQFIEKNLSRIPVALNIEVSNGFKLTAFLISARAFIEQSSPGMVVWENVNYKDQPYVKLSPSAQARGQNPDLAGMAFYYRATGEALLITPNEALLKRSIDRQLDRNAAKNDGKPAANPPALPGESLVMRAQGKFYDFIAHAYAEQFQIEMQRRSWSNLAILNEWKSKYPDRDLVKIYAQYFHARLIDPAGGEYKWNEKWQTMESTIYGCPAEPKKGPPGIAALRGLLRTSFGITFENSGLRAKAEIDREAKK